jgi:DNA invertase Pin-like site-specific DNA recombinase
MMMQMLGCFAEFERAMARERTRAGLKTARERSMAKCRPILLPLIAIWQQDFARRKALFLLTQNSVA